MYLIGNVSWTHIKEIPNTTLLVSLHNSYNKAANLEIVDIPKKGFVRKIYSFEEVIGCNISCLIYSARRMKLRASYLVVVSSPNLKWCSFLLVTGPGFAAFNPNRNVLGAISLGGEIAYHLFNIDFNASLGKYNVKLLRKSKWHTENTSTGKQRNLVCLKMTFTFLNFLLRSSRTILILC